MVAGWARARGLALATASAGFLATLLLARRRLQRGTVAAASRSSKQDQQQQEQHLCNEKPAAERPAAVRHAEKNRSSTSPFADEVAHAVIAEYERRRPQTWKHRQTVVAAILVHETSRPCDQDTGQQHGKMFVAAFGVGTKFLSSGERRMVIRDMHAEVLARRAFVRFLHQDVLRCLAGEEGKLLELRPSHNSAGCVVAVRGGASVHMYSSSVPCGNAAWKRWSKGGKPSPNEDVPGLPWPLQRHQRLQIHARREGQVCFLAKHSAWKDCTATEEKVVTVHHLGDDASARSGGWPAGTHPCCNACEPLSCSDRLAQWNALGLQGRALCQLMAQPIVITTCTVGRKFSWAHCARALCCRLQDFTPEHVAGLPPMFGIRHPVLLCTAVKLSTDVYEGSSGADFQEHRCLCWGHGDEAAEVLDGHSGYTEDGSISRFAGHSLAVLHATWARQIVGCSEALGEDSYRIAKMLLQQFVDEKCSMREKV